MKAKLLFETSVRMRKWLMLSLLLFFSNLFMFYDAGGVITNIDWVATAGRNSNPRTSPFFAADIDGYYQTSVSTFLCSRNYFFTAYPDDTVAIELIPAQNLGEILDMRFRLYRNDTLLSVVYNTLANNYFVGNPLQLLPLGIPGRYKVEFSTSDLGIWYVKQVIRYNMIPKIQKVWIEADAICGPFVSAPSDNKIHFRIKTIPEIDDVMLGDILFQTSTRDPGNTYCQTDEGVKLGINCNIVGTGGDIYLVHSVFDSINTIPSSLPRNGNNDVKGSYWMYDQYGHNTTYQSQFWAYYNDPIAGYTYNIGDYISSSGAKLGLPLTIQMNFTDGVDLNVNLSAPILVNNTANSLSTYHGGSYTVSSLAEIWTPQNNPVQKMYGSDQAVFRVRDSIVIPAGKTLEIRDMQVELGPNAKILVKTAPGTSTPGAYLKLDNSTLTSLDATSCGLPRERWKGVEVWGDASKPQGQTTIGSYSVASWQGTLETINGSVISNANQAVATAGPDPVNRGLKNGGVILANGSSFINNIKGAEFSQYPVRMYPTANLGKAYRSYFENCDFEVNSNIPSTTFYGFVGGNSVKGIPVLGCRMINNGGPVTPGYNLGVYGWDFGVKVNQIVPFSGPSIPCEFDNLSAGVLVASVSGTASADVRHSEFRNNAVGIRSSGTPVPYIRSNTMQIAGGDETTNGLGVHINTGSGYEISDNSFTPFTSQPYTTGVLITSTGADNNMVHSNSYDGLWCGNLSNFMNRNPVPTNPDGLQFLCNANTNNTHDVAARGNLYSSEGMAEKQGSLIQSAGNTFSASAFYHIYNYTSEVQAINYYFYTGTPVQAPTVVYGTTTNSTPPLNPCSYPNEPGTGGVIYQGPIGSGPITNRMRVSYFLNDPTGIETRDSLFGLLGPWNSPYSDLLRADLLIEDGLFNEANNAYDSIVSKHSLSGVEYDEFIYWGRRLMDVRIALSQDSLTSADLNGTQVTELEQIADSAKMWAQVRAQNWLTLYDGRLFSPNMLFPQNTMMESRTQEQNNERRINLPAIAPYQLVPNPVENFLEVQFANTKELQLQFILTDVTGRRVLTSELKSLSGSVQLDLRQLEHGIYFYSIIEDGNPKLSGKILKK